MSSLEDRLDYDAEAWKPEAGDTLVGEIVDMSQITGDYGPYTVFEIRKSDGVVMAWHAFHGVAKSKVAELEPKIGDNIGIRFLGEVKTKPGSKYDSYKGYKIKLERADGDVPDAPDWNAQGADANAELAQTEYASTTVDGDGEPF